MYQSKSLWNYISSDLNSEKTPKRSGEPQCCNNTSKPEPAVKGLSAKSLNHGPASILLKENNDYKKHMQAGSVACCQSETKKLQKSLWVSVVSGF